MKSTVITVGLVFLAVAMWWMESRFGAQFAMAVMGSLVGAVIIVSGVLLGLTANRASLSAAAEFHAATQKTEQARLSAERERVKGENERIKIERVYTEALTKHNLLDAKRIDKMAQDRAKLLTQNNANAPTWDVDGDDVTYPQPEKRGRVGRAVDAVESLFSHDEDW